jgi:hypothetical protein
MSNKAWFLAKLRQGEINSLKYEQAMDDKLNYQAREFGNSVSLEQAGLEEDSQQPLFGNTDGGAERERLDGGVSEYVEWFSDGEDSRFESN